MLNVIYESPPLSLVEYSQLEKNIIADGCREPLVVFNNTLVDGHNRYEICTKHDLPFSILDKEFADSGAAKLWMIRNQFGRRNLSSFQRASLALEMKPMLAEIAKDNQTLSSGAGVKGLHKSANLNPIDTRKELAKEAGVSHDTISKVEKILAFADDETKQKLKNGELTIYLFTFYNSILKFH